MQLKTRRHIFERLSASGGDEAPSGQTTVIDVARYTDPTVFEAEKRAIFGRVPVIVAHVSQLTERGAILTAQLGDVPLIVLNDGLQIRVFANQCRHRGAELVQQSPHCVKALTCPYHAWTYRLDGSLMHVPEQQSFGDLELHKLGLHEFSSEVRHGFVWVSRSGPPEVAGFLGPAIDADFEAFGLDQYTVGDSRIHQRRANWKLVMDAFCEGYHLRYLHKKSVAKFFGSAALLDHFSPHIRQVGARRTLAQTFDDFDLDDQTTVFYDLFPNSVLVFHPGWLSHLELIPVAVDQVRIVHRMLIAPSQATAEEAANGLRRSFELIDGSVFQAEDFAIAESIQRTLAAGLQEEMLLGTQEEGMRLFHAARDRWLYRPSSTGSN